MVKQIVTKDTAIDTKTRILEAANSLFIEYGFAGTSISAIAQAAGVTRSLIFHHYATKEQLWTAVKQQLLSVAGVSLSLRKTDDIKDQAQNIIASLITERFKFYTAHEAYFRLTCWQVLDRQTAGVGFGDAEFYSDFKKLIKSMQDNDLLDKKLDAKVLLVALIGSVYAPFMLDHILPLNAKQKQQYLQLMQDVFVSLFN